ncbi:MAG TPA: twin-arginine translocase TatA/TatE family subunit [Dongiaceae bacterium]|nr:twin-arginine translocase TatA/TatE family subunit [Dongiaceae bacterium]
MGLSFWHIMLVAVLVLLLFGKGKVPQLMGDIAEGIRNFKSGLREDDADTTARANTAESRPQASVTAPVPPAPDSAKIDS